MECGVRDKQVLAGLYPPFADMALYFMARCWGIGINVHLSQGLRSFEDEDAIFAKGLSHTKGGQSLHNYGLAFDIIFNDPESPDTSHNPYVGDWERAANIGFRCGLQPGFYWSSFKDKPHYQAKIVTKIEDLLAIYQKDTLSGVWKHLDDNEPGSFLLPKTDAIMAQ